MFNKLHTEDVMFNKLHTEDSTDAIKHKAYVHSQDVENFIHTGENFKTTFIWR